MSAGYHSVQGGDESAGTIYDACKISIRIFEHINCKLKLSLIQSNPSCPPLSRSNVPLPRLQHHVPHAQLWLSRLCNCSELLELIN
jgi:hypothetical protein